MLTGKRACDRDSAPETMAAILRDDPPMDEGSSRNLPPALRDLLDRCLEKKPDRRLASMQELSAELSRLGPQSSSSNLLSGHFFWPRRRRVLWGAIAASLAILLAVAGLWRFLGHRDPMVSEASIAVLPFEDMSEGKNQEYLSEGISEELLNLLAKIPALHVISRTSAFSFKGKHLGIPEIARQLKVAKILEGSVRKSGNRVRITAQLIDARTDTHLWSATYDRQIDDLFTVQDEIAAAVVGQLKVTLLGAPLKSQKVDPRAYDLYLQAIQIARKGEPGGTAQSIGLLKEALALAPDYASAWQLLAWNYIAEVGYGTRPAQEGIGRAREAVEKALTLDPQDARGYIRLADVEMNLEVNLASAAKHLERAWALDPVLASGGAAALARKLGRGELAIAMAQSFAAHDPLNPFSYSNLAYGYSVAGHFDEALANYRTALKLSPQMLGIHSQICFTLLLKGDAQGALAEIQREPEEINRLMGLTLIYHALGETAKSDAALAEMIRKYGHDNPYNVAEALAFRREADHAFEQLDKAAQIQDSGLVDLATDEFLANLHGDRRWLPLLRKLGQAPEQLAAIKFDVKPPTGRGRGN
jgi:TolB-like protein/Tfp pilus assembly protein PilF